MCTVGVYHFSALGLSPGAVTLPLSTIYSLIVGAYLKGYEDAKEFFKYSGERGQEMKGAPETIIIFTTGEIMGTSGKDTQLPIRNNVHSNLFGKTFKKGTPVIRVVGKYLSLIYDFLENQGLKPFYGSKWIKHIYLVRVQHKDYKDAFNKIGITMKGHRDKEVWINMIAGTNQQTIAMLNTSLFFGTATRYYYIFQTDESLLDSIYLKNEITEGVVEQLLQQWNSLPIFFTGRYGFFIVLLKRLKEYNNMIPASILRNDAREYDVKLEKLGGFLHLDSKKEVFYPTKELKNIISLYRDIVQSDVNNHSEWKKWCVEEQILYVLNLDGTVEQVTKK